MNFSIYFSFQVVLSIDARSGYEFSSTISLRTSDLSKYSVTQTKKEIRTGNVVTKRFEVYGSGVTQELVIERTGQQRRTTATWDGGYGGPPHSRSLDDSLPSLSYDYASDASDIT